MLARHILIISLVSIGLSQPLWADETINTPPTKQSFYKWIDEKGVTHYSATPPSPKEVAKKVKKVQTDVPVRQTASETAPDKKPAAPAESPVEPPKALTSTTTKERPDLNAERDQSCQAAQKNLQLLKDKRRIYQKTETGERRFLTDKEMEEKAKTTQQFVKDNC